MEAQRKDSTNYRKITISLGERGAISDQREERLTKVIEDMDCNGLSKLIQEIADGNIYLKKRPSFMSGRRFE